MVDKPSQALCGTVCVGVLVSPEVAERLEAYRERVQARTPERRVSLSEFVRAAINLYLHLVDLTEGASHEI